MSSSRRDHSRAINPQLLQATAWLLHRDKQPYYSNGTPRRGKLDVPADLAKLATYEAALATLNGGGQFTGLGIAINRGLQFIDLDKVRTRRPAGSSSGPGPCSSGRWRSGPTSRCR